MLKYEIKEYKKMELIGSLFEKGSVNLIYGESGVGKTITTMKLLNKQDIVPILIDYDNNRSPDENQCKYIHIDGYLMNKDNKLNIPIDKVIVIDTYSRYMDSGNTHDFLNKLSEHGNTVIVVAHNKNIATKRDIPDVDEQWSNHLGSKIWMDRTKVGANIHILKSRGYVGDRIVKVAYSH